MSFSKNDNTGNHEDDNDKKRNRQSLLFWVVLRWKVIFQQLRYSDNTCTRIFYQPCVSLFVNDPLLILLFLLVGIVLFILGICLGSLAPAGEAMYSYDSLSVSYFFSSTFYSHNNKNVPHGPPYSNSEIDILFRDLDHRIIHNIPGGVQWIEPHLLLPLPEEDDNGDKTQQRRRRQQRQQILRRGRALSSPSISVVKRNNQLPMKWEDEYHHLLMQRRRQQQLQSDPSAAKNNNPSDKVFKPKVDYTTYRYEYPPIQSKPAEGYPQFQTMEEILRNWPQDNDIPQNKIYETLIHFNFSNPEELKMAKQFRDAEVPFKLTNVPEVIAASKKWTDEYVSSHFEDVTSYDPTIVSYCKRFFLPFLKYLFFSGKGSATTAAGDDSFKKASGYAQESSNHYFAFYSPDLWDVNNMGLPPVRSNDWTYKKWSQHANYADAVSLSEDQPHFYWQAGVPPEERHEPNKNLWTFISKDLPSFSSPRKTFFVFHPKEQKGIQCRFGERGVVAATHYDSGRNMIAMVKGAKRYILSPPNQCKQLGIHTSREQSVYRHSLLDFGHINYLLKDDNDDDATNTTTTNTTISNLERLWLHRAKEANVLETVLKEGEVLYIPSFWFHYIMSLQKSAQCNVRSGVGTGNGKFGNQLDVTKNCNIMV